MSGANGPETGPRTAGEWLDGDDVVAVRDWYTRARVRIIAEQHVTSVDPRVDRRYRVGEEVVMLQVGRRGRPIKRDSWWSSFDTDAAFIIDSAAVEVIEILSETDPLVPSCGSMKPDGYTFDECHESAGHGGKHRNLYGDEW